MLDFDDSTKRSYKIKVLLNLDPKNDVEGIDAAHKLSILSVLCFGVKFNFNECNL